MNRRVLVWALIVLVGVNVLVLVVDAVAPGPSGRASSSLATTPDGFAAWAELARRNGIEVVPLREDLVDARLPDGATVVALDVPDLTPEEARALRGADRVLAGGEDAEGWVDAFDPSLGWTGSGPAGTQRVGDLAVRTRGEGRWTGSGEGLLVRRGDATLLADASPLRNGALTSADNAAFALDLAGDGPLVFAESLHGYGSATGLAALPGAAKGALVLLLVAAGLLMAARGRRFGPPEAAERELPPPRAEYVDALGATLARTKDPEGAMAPVRAALAGAGGEPIRDDAGAVELARQLQATRGGHR